MNAEIKNKDTKMRIIDVAGELFAENGFASTSVREIAKLADVNISAINYHFKSKEALYWEVFNFHSIWMEDQIEQIGADEALNTQDFTLKVFDFFVEHNHPLMNTFKILLSKNISLSPEDIEIKCRDDIGPPGHKIFYEKIRKEVKAEVSDEQVIWAVKMIFSVVVHFGVMSATTLFQEKSKLDPGLTHEALKESISQMVEANLMFINSKIANR